MTMKLADLKITTHVLQHDEDLVYSGYVHPQIDDKSLIRVIAENYDLSQAQYSVIVEGPGPAGPYTFDVQPIREHSEEEIKAFQTRTKARREQGITEAWE